MSDSNRLPSASRRGFAKSTVLAAAAPALAGAAIALGQTAPTPSPALTPVPTPEAPSSVAEALPDVARLRWGKHLSGEQLGEIARARDGRLKGAEAMKKVKLTNADEPDVVFFAELPGDR